MKLSQFKSQLAQTENLVFVLQNGTKVPAHFHITEVGMTTKQFADCGNTFRIQKNSYFSIVDFGRYRSSFGGQKSIKNH